MCSGRVGYKPEIFDCTSHESTKQLREGRYKERDDTALSLLNLIEATERFSRQLVTQGSTGSTDKYKTKTE